MTPPPVFCNSEGIGPPSADKTGGGVNLPRRFPLLPRKKNTSKSDYGHVLVLAGSKGLTGAAILASRAALRSGSGLVTLGMPRSLEASMAKSLVEVMKLGLPETKVKTLSLTAYSKILDFIKRRKINSLAIGPGLSVNSETTALVRRLVGHVSAPIVLDADGLNSFSAKGGSASGGKGYLQDLRKHRSQLILTPHEKEFERLFSKRLPSKKSARIALAKRLSKFYDVVLVLKGPQTLVVYGNKVYCNKTGNPGLAKGGSGDVLTGMIASFIAQGLDIFQASVWGVYFHGKAADIAVKEKGELGLIASDLIDCLPRVFRWSSSAGRATVL